MLAPQIPTKRCASDQRDVWDGVDKMLYALGAASPTPALSDGFEERVNAIGDYVTAFKLQPGQVGVLYRIGGVLAASTCSPRSAPSPGRSPSFHGDRPSRPSPVTQGRAPVPGRVRFPARCPHGPRRPFPGRRPRGGTAYRHRHHRRWRPPPRRRARAPVCVRSSSAPSGVMGPHRDRAAAPRRTRCCGAATRRAIVAG
jgi:hypothetical protein